MKKHLIVHGDNRSGKTLFIMTLLSKHFENNYTKFDGKRLNRALIPTTITYSSKFARAIYLMDVPRSINPDYFIAFTDKIGDCKMVIEFSEELQEITEDASFTRRFDLINTNTISYKDLMNYLNKNNAWNKKNILS